MDTRFLRWITLTATGLSLIGLIISALMGLQVALGFGLGAALAVGNLWLLSRLGARLLEGDARSKGRLVGLFMLKFTLFIGIIFGVTLGLPTHPLALMAGLSVVLLAILLGALIGPSPARGGA
ncbi:hypothetical protein KKF91_12275 [Myxococcota bacterium]|nr:hypothetical protein [Myxococcota bacterium]MBU1431308.1 hypothetical protein [Myxococcota bacterium]MBU1898928.1 hypothetical protein [Myxococcota bacterium]